MSPSPAIRFLREDVLALMPARHANYGPLLADALAFFLGALPGRGRGASAESQVAAGLDHSMRSDTNPLAGPIESVVALMHAHPTLHKLGQVVSRHRELDAAFRRQLQQLESLEPRTPLEEIAPIVRRELGEDVRAFDIEFDRGPLAEASVAVVWGFTWRPPGESHRRRGVCKVLRPGVADRLAAELAILPEVADFLDDHRGQYDLPPFDFRSTLATVRELLAGEVVFAHEQRNLAEAARRFAGRRRVVVPELLPFSTPNVTAMSFVPGERITDAAGADPSLGQRLGRTVVDALLADVVLSSAEDVTFHADPHAGNLRAAPGGRLGILDWSLTGRLNRGQAEACVQMMAAGLTADRRRMAEALGRLLREPRGQTDQNDAGCGHTDNPDDAGRVAVAIDRAFALLEAGARPGVRWLTQSLDAAAAAGLTFLADLMLFRKVLLTVEGVFADCDPAGSIDAILTARLLEHFWAEWPLRAWTLPFARPFATHLSNVDVLQLAVASPWRGVLT